MVTIFDVAKYILDKLNTPISVWKLHKLCFYAQAWTIAWTEKPLFSEDFQAWNNGPVCPELYNLYKNILVLSSNDIVGNPDNLSENQLNSIDTVLKSYGFIEPYDLQEIVTHELPWLNTKKYNIISKTSMGEYYGGL